MATDILYIVGKQKSQWHNNELRYSLRSIEKYGRNVGRVFVVGAPPAFLSDEVQTLKIRDPYDVKHKNILYCIDQAMKQLPLGEDVLYSSDDHYYIRETDFDCYPIYCKGVLPCIGTSDYRVSLKETRALLELCGMSTHNFSWHGNTHFYKSVWLSDAFQKLLQIQWQCTEQGAEPTCLMLNYYNSRVQPLRYIERDDCKLFDFTQAEAEHRLTERECVSTDDGIDNAKWFASWLNKEFKQPSKYERKD